MERLNQWLMVLANLGVVAGIVFLAIEIDQNSTLLRTEASLKMLENRQRLRLQIYENPEIATLVQRVTSGEELTDTELFRIRARVEASLLGWEWEYQQYLDGNLTELPLDIWRSRLNTGVESIVGWDSAKPLLTPEFLKLIEGQVEQQ